MQLFFLLIIPLYLGDTFVLAFIAGFALPKGWDLARERATVANA